MKDIKDLLAVFLDLIKLTPSGSQVQFSINYMKDKITIVSAPRGFIILIYQNDRFCTHLRPEGLKVQMFK